MVHIAKINVACISMLIKEKYIVHFSVLSQKNSFVVEYKKKILDVMVMVVVVVIWVDILENEERRIILIIQVRGGGILEDNSVIQVGKINITYKCPIISGILQTLVKGDSAKK